MHVTGHHPLYRTKLCSMYRTAGGLCTAAADMCQFAHSQLELRENISLARTSMCKQGFRGSICEHPDTCTYAHTISELRHTPFLHKTDLCEYFARGRCNKGMLCRMAHGDHELRRDALTAKSTDHTVRQRGAQNCHYNVIAVELFMR